ncbi:MULTISPECIES: bifunctional DNA primase/polymerase [unclassified Bradyrhizobium]|uniref:bifunctional DNA primase/polymerase n=1 Tax=unclassified Bradyrhizobium TaxID=2631580 RepID=UPI002479F444|nr:MULTISPECIES: bifunctional DNA primase/polymerase [unclassified Bradyrhizobium]WGS18950.1 bifunctional DNA primase/polymerase [Bradyrhizobium sp. ISRA463]WGS25783.1 bifunctional DNA primase/polymerase [Bradyrhizobium sp. ISRA464]
MNFADKWKLAVFPARIEGKSKKSYKSADTAEGEGAGINWGATRNLDEIRNDFADPTRQMIGIPTGARNGIFVLDVDTIEGGHTFDGFASLAMLEARHGPLPPTLMAESPSGSRHYFFKHPGFEVKTIAGTDAKGLAPGIDVKGDGGFVIAPPSIKPNGDQYRWLNAGHTIAEAPQWLRDLPVLRKSEQIKADRNLPTIVAPAGHRPSVGTHAAKVLADACEKIATTETGRNDELNKQALKVGRYVANGEIATDVAVHDLLAACGENGLLAEDGERQCLATIQSGLGAGRKDPAKTITDMFGNSADTIAAPSLAPAATTLIKSSGEFLRGFVPPDYILDGVLQRGFCYSMTAKTGTGKTAVAMCFSAHVATGRPLNGLGVSQGSVVYLAGENPTDIQMRWLGLTQEMRIDPETVPVYFLPGVVSISQNVANIEREVKDRALFPTLVVVDTAAAYFEGDNENDNVQQGNNARLLRSLTRLPGGPCVLILCHPTKRAADDDLLPRGGGAFLNEVDGNIALKANDTIVGAEAQGKFRGPAFSPLAFKLDAVREHPLLKDSKGRNIPTVIARAISDSEMASNAASQERDENRLLRTIEKHPKASLQELAGLLRLNKSKVNRLVEKLTAIKMVRREGRKLVLTQIGEKELNSLDAIVSPSFQPLLGGGRFPLPILPQKQ